MKYEINQFRQSFDGIVFEKMVERLGWHAEYNMLPPDWTINLLMIKYHSKTGECVHEKHNQTKRHKVVQSAPDTSQILEGEEDYHKVDQTVHVDPHWNNRIILLDWKLDLHA